MKPLKPPHPPAHKKLAPANPKPNQLTRFETSKLRRLGQQDGHHALPKQDENGIWTSPLLRKECGSYNEFCISAWTELQSRHEKNYKEIARLCQEIPMMEEQLIAHRNNAPPPADLTERINGEEKLSDYIIHNRRQREHEKRYSSYFSKLRQLESKIENSYRQLTDLQSIILAAEKTTRMLCEQSAGNTEQRIMVYWHGALSKHPKFKEIPPSPEIILESSAESDYSLQNKPIHDEANRILDHRKHGGTITNINRTEEYYV